MGVIKRAPVGGAEAKWQALTLPVGSRRRSAQPTV